MHERAGDSLEHGWQNNSPQSVCVLIPGTCKYIILPGEKVFSDVRGYADLSRWPYSNTRILKNGLLLRMWSGDMTQKNGLRNAVLLTLKTKRGGQMPLKVRKVKARDSF